MKWLLVIVAAVALVLWYRKQQSAPVAVAPVAPVTSPTWTPEEPYRRVSKIIPDYYYNPVPAGRYVPRDPSGIIHRQGGQRPL